MGGGDKCRLHLVPIHNTHGRVSNLQCFFFNSIPVKDVAEAVFTLVEFSCVLFRGDVFSNLLDVDDRSLFVRAVPNPSPNLSFRAASNISVLFDVASALLTVVK